MTNSALDPLVVLTGAGISAASGVPTYRGVGGFWQNYRAQDLATPEAFQHDPALVWRFYHWRRNLVHQCKPNQAHYLLASIEDKLDDFVLITQNVDGLHQAAGSRRVIELHGSIWRLKCTKCENRWMDLTVPMKEDLPTCPKCGALARPDIIWFGEPLNAEDLERAYFAAGRSRFMLVIGTSSVVQPAAQIPIIAHEAGARLIEINPEITPLTAFADVHLRGSAISQLALWWESISP